MLIPPGFLAIGGGFWIANLVTSVAEYKDLALNSNGDVYSSQRVVLSGQNDLQLVKRNNAGNIIWQRRLDSGGEDGIYSNLRLDSSSNLYLSGGMNVFVSGRNALAKYNSSGGIQWQKDISTSTNDPISKIAVDASANIYEAMHSFAGGRYALGLRKYDTSGNVQWDRVIDQSSNAITIRALDIEVDSGGNVVVLSTLSSSSILQRLFIVKYNSSGTLQWQRELSASSTVLSNAGLAIDGSDNVIIVSKIEVGSTVTGLVAKYNSSGTLQWQRQYSGSFAAGENFAVAVDSIGDIYASMDNNILKYNSSGVLQWQRAFSTNARCYAIQVDNNAFYGVGSMAFKMPKDGSATGTYVVNGVTYQYSVISFSETAASLTSSTPTYTDQVASYSSPTTSSFTDAATTFTQAIEEI